MKPKIAHINYLRNIREDVDELFGEKGISVASARTLDDFLKEHGDLTDYKILLYHPGIKEQHRLKEIKEKYPNLTLALFTPSRQHYLNSDIPFLSSMQFEQTLDFVRYHLENDN